jgi:hypothetical protein
MLRKRRLDAVRTYQKYMAVHFGTDALALKGSGLPAFGPSSTLEYGSEDFQNLEEILIEFDAEKGFKGRNRVHNLDVVEEVASNSAVKYEDLRDI